LAKDHFAYVGAYKKAIDEIEQYKKELWNIMTDPGATNMEKIQITKELHNLTKSFTLLLSDLTFVTNLSKYYDLELTDLILKIKLDLKILNAVIAVMKSIKN
jgi:hypothetical protein